jgi:penicillin-binding protein 1A
MDQTIEQTIEQTMDQTYRRKAQELVLAVWLETKFTKKEILARVRELEKLAKF